MSFLLKQKTITDVRSDLEFNDPQLTRIHKATRFVIDLKTGRVLKIFKNSHTGKVIQMLLDEGVIDNVDKLRNNAYGDILILKKKK